MEAHKDIFKCTESGIVSNDKHTGFWAYAIFNNKDRQLSYFHLKNLESGQMIGPLMMSPGDPYAQIKSVISNHKNVTSVFAI
ncbi:hypothetical protein [Jeotgalibacillus malaysiensis]|uniref:hypothetical protein n=1 Tax=Jeotgalibacillus malaysiensis TaxID=1508404 RepID=UPI00384FBA40